MLDEAVKEMLSSVKTFNEPKYECENGKIGYVDGD